MKKIYHPFWLWEDHAHDMFKQECADELAYKKAQRLLSDPEEFRIVANKVIREWKCSTEMNLSNLSRNRQAWLGQAACCYAYGVPEFMTKYGWRFLTEEQQAKANAVADEVIKYWEDNLCPKSI